MPPPLRLAQSSPRDLRATVASPSPPHARQRRPVPAYSTPSNRCTRAISTVRSGWIPSRSTAPTAPEVLDPQRQCPRARRTLGRCRPSLTRFFLARFVVALLLVAWSAAAGPRPGKVKDAGADGATHEAGLDAAGDTPGDSADDGMDAAADAPPVDDAAAEAGVPPSAPLPSAPASPSAPPPPSSSARASSPSPGDAAGGAPVRIHDRKVFVVHVPRGGQSAAQRATNATQALEHAVDDTDA